MVAHDPAEPNWTSAPWRDALARSARPERAAVGLARLLAAVPDPAALVARLAMEPRLLDNLLTLLVGSEYLGGVLVRHPAYLDWLLDARARPTLEPPGELTRRARAAMRLAAGEDDPVAALCRFQQGELLRIGWCDLLGAWDVGAVTRQLSHLADALVAAALDVAADAAGQGDEPGARDGLVVLALGKLGGAELNYSSDIDLVFVAREASEAGGRVAVRLIEALTRVTAEGFLYRVDMRLRPWGQVGPLVATRDGYLRYLREHARVWEKQALLKARPIAGDVALGVELLAAAAPLMYALDRRAVQHDVREIKRRIEAQLAAQDAAWGEVKLGVGSIRDVEFVTQYLQLAHGGLYPEVRSPNTLDALWRLYARGILPRDDYRMLADGYTFLRPVEHLLQLMASQQTHQLPREPSELAFLARRLGFEEPDAGRRFLGRYAEHSQTIRAVYRRYLEDESVPGTHEPAGSIAPASLDRHLDRLAGDYAALYGPDEIVRHVRMAERLHSGNLVELWTQPRADGAWAITLVAYDYPGELSLICGLLFVYGLTILDGQVFTYEPLAAAGSPTRHDGRRKIVDAFTVRPALGAVTEATWASYQRDLAGLLSLVEQQRPDEARGRLTQLVADVLRELPPAERQLYPIDLEIDNASSPSYTVLRISTQDTMGFLYEFTNALALFGVQVSRVTVASDAQRVRDVFALTDARGAKIVGEAQQRELRVAAVLVKHFTHLLPHSSNPGGALHHFREFLTQLLQRPDWPGELASLERPEVLLALARLLGVSDFLWEDFLRMQHANLFPVVRDVDALATARSRAQLAGELQAALAAAADRAAAIEALNAFKDRETFRVDMRHIQGHIREFGQFSAELTDVVEVVVEAAHCLCYDALCVDARHGEPRLADGGPNPLAVCGLGKLGGRELGYASDIELMFVYAGEGETAGPEPIGAGEFYSRLVRDFLAAIRARREGIFTVDLRLRPYGDAGSLAVPLASFERYFAPGGPAWFYERQALVKLRPVAGSAGLGQRVAALRDRFVYAGLPIDAEAIRAMRERQLRHLVTAEALNAKFGRGGLVDVEYLVQVLQMRHGHRFAQLRQANTQLAMAALAEAGILSVEEYRDLSLAYVFLRHLIDALRMERGNARDLTVPPASSPAFGFLARRLSYGEDRQRLQRELRDHTANVQALFERLLDAEAFSERPTVAPATSTT
ncbi:MAG: glutamine synthetase adenylyltransferase [Chloroflexota bacterium]